MTRASDIALFTAVGFALGMTCTILALEPLIALVWRL